jgi:4-hydroxybenzoate polyprenyltransferase
VRAALRALRPHQWAKNLLVFVAAVGAHIRLTPAVAGRLALAFLAFSLLASAGYLLNDLADLPHDRAHPTKRRRPIAAGELPRPRALALAAALAGGATLLAALLPPRFAAVLAGYLVLTLAYSLGLKRLAVLDVIALATLYTARIIGGAVVVGAPLSQHFVAFSIFVFLSLALVKRVVELQDAGAWTAGRGYVAGDVPVLTGLGLGCAAASALVYVMYATGEEATRYYRHPVVLLAGLPVLLYWISRLWLLTSRRVMDEDPVVFALLDPASYATLAALLVIVFLAT